AAASQRVLRPAQAFVLVLEDRPSVVVETTNEIGIEIEGDLFCGQRLLDDAKGLGARCAQMIDDTRRIALERLVLGILRVEKTERVLLEARPALFAQRRKVRPVILAQEFPVSRPAHLIPNAVEVEAHAANVERGKPVPAN